jgi:DNA-binding transcriptional regulator YiaG
MSNVEKILKTEIARISRKEIKAAIGEIGKSQAGLRKTVVDLKKRVASLEKENKRLVAGARKQDAFYVEKPSEASEKAARLTSKGVRSLRNRLGLTQAEFAKLAGTSTHSVYLWEKKEGPLKLRDKTREALLSIRELGAKEAKTRIDEVEGTHKKGRRRVSRK